MLKTIFVTGSTGNQGGAVAASLLKNGFKVKALTRKPGSARAQGLAKQGAEVVKGDLNDLGSLRSHLEGVDGVFSVQTFDKGVVAEIKQGKNLADLAKENGVGHFLYTSVAGADLNTGIPHFESKWIIEKHIKQIGLPYTIIRPTSLFENFLLPPVRSRIEKGTLSSPVRADRMQQLISAVDIGEISANIFLNRDQYSRKTITVASEEMDMEQVAKVFSEVLGKEIKYQKLPMIITRLVMGKDLYKMFKWLNENNTALADVAAYKKGNNKLLSLKQWIEINFKGGS